MPMSAARKQASSEILPGSADNHAGVDRVSDDDDDAHLLRTGQRELESSVSGAGQR